MKNLKLAALSILAAGSLASCSGGGMTAKLNTQTDSISYALGVTQFSPEIRSMIIEQYDNDSTVVDKIIEGISYGKTHLDAKTRAYQMGVGMGQGISIDMIKQMNQMILNDEDATLFKSETLVSALKDALQGKESEWANLNDAQEYFRVNQDSLKEMYDTAKAEGDLQNPELIIKADSIVKALAGMQFQSNLGEMITQEYDGDAKAVENVMRGLEFGLAHTGNSDKAYAMGISMAQGISTSMLDQIHQGMLDTDEKVLSADNILSVFALLLKGEIPVMSVEEAQQYLEVAVPTLKSKLTEGKFADYKKENEEFLTKNAKAEGVFVTDSGLQYRVLTEGSGNTYVDGQKAVVNYEGSLIDNTVFDSSYKRNEPATFDPHGLVKGFKEAVMQMPVGSIWEVYIPQELGYGVSSMGLIKPYSTLIFKIEVLDFQD